MMFSFFLFLLEKYFIDFFSNTQSQTQWEHWKAAKQASDCRSDWFEWMMKNIENFQKKNVSKKIPDKMNENFSL